MTSAPRLPDTVENAIDKLMELWDDENACDLDADDAEQELRAAVVRYGLEQRLEQAGIDVVIAGRPYSDDVLCRAGMEPQEVGERIAAAITRRIKQDRDRLRRECRELGDSKEETK